jgi:DNA-binding transcriptional LysR family regulator
MGGLMPKDASLTQLRTFLRIVERGSLSAAARDLGTTQPTVSRQLLELETVYRLPLVTRTTRSLRLTDAGKLVYEQAQLVVQADELLRERLLNEIAKVEGRIRISASSGFGTFVVAPFCSHFIARHPDIVVDLCLTDRRADLVSEGLDMAIRIGWLDSSGLYAKPLAVLEEIIVIAPHCLTRKIKDPDDLESLPWVSFAGFLDRDHVYLERRGKRQKIEIKVRMTVDQIIGHREALLAGAGAGLIHRYIVDADIREGRLVQLLPDWTLPDWPVHVLFPVKKQTYRLRRWIDEFEQEIGSIPGMERR